MNDLYESLKIASGKESGVMKIVTERFEQIQKHGYLAKDDVLHNPNEELIQAARALMKQNPVEHDFPEHWGVAACRKMMLKPYTERLVIAGALLAAEIDRRKYIQEVMGKRNEVKVHRKACGCIIKPHHPLTPNECFKSEDQ